MKEEEEKLENGKTNLDETKKMDRRSFMVNTAKVLIPTLGILGLTLSEFSSKAFAASCSGTCASGCFGCTGGCAGECNRTCRDICANSCTVGCSSNSK